MAETPNDKSLLDQIKELWQLVLAYFKQETVEPVRNLGRFVLFGLAGSLVLGLGLILLMLSALRALQTETGSHLQGNNSWIPYVIVLIASVILIGAAVAGIARSRPSGGKEGASQ
jgi:putative superfamily III holin-X